MGWNQHLQSDGNAIILQEAKMGGHISRLIPRLALIAAAVLCSGCEEPPKPQPPASPFDEQQAIVSYDEIKKGELTVQIGVIHKSLNAAVIIAARLRASSIANFIETTENCDVYRVCVGKFRSMARAKRVKEDLLRKNLRCGEIQVMGPLKEKVGPCK
jgi:cell division septation protein DedD